MIRTTIVSLTAGALFLVSHSEAFHIQTQRTVYSTRPAQQWPLFDSSSGEEDEVPSMDWLTNSLAKEGGDKPEKMTSRDMTENPFVEEYDREGGLGDVPIPSTGVSVSDEMDKAQQDRFFSELVPIVKGMEPGVKAAQIVTTGTAGSFEPVRYLIGLGKETATKTSGGEDSKEEVECVSEGNSFVMVDVPPFSEKLAKEMIQFMGKGGRLDSIVLTCRDCIHYDEAPGVFAIRRADLVKWEKSFPNSAIVAYRLDIPRDCRESITQRLDGYGPFALDESEPGKSTFVETGRPLTREEWNPGMTQDIMDGNQTPPDDEEVVDEGVIETNEADDYSPAGIRRREEGKRLLAIFTPGRTYGSVSYIFPEVGLCASGFTIPVEDNRQDENLGMQSAGPAMDVRGFITTSKAGVSKLMESARHLTETYSDRFNVVLASRGDPLFLDGDDQERKQELSEILEQYEKVGQTYEQVGAFGSD